MTAVIWSVSLTLGFCLLSASADAADCTHYATRGKRYDIPLEKDSKEKRLIWTKVATRVYDSKKQVNEYSVTEEGSLILPKVTKADEGDYTWALTNTDGRQVGKKELKLCVLETVSKPTVTFKCNDANRVLFTCTGTQPDGVTYEWFEGVSVVANANAQLLDHSFNQVGSNSFFCNVSNPVSSERSDRVQPDCFKTTTPVSPVSPHSPDSPDPPARDEDEDEDDDDDDLLFGLNFWLMVGLLAGGGGLVLVLIVGTIVCCSINRRKRQL